jgi:DNA-binding transcriptional regulator/RsmH inhibitor MraZ
VAGEDDKRDQQPSTPEPPLSITETRVDDKGRLKLPAEFLEYLRASKVDKVFITTVDLQLARIYPLSVWKSNEILFQNAGELAELAEDVAIISKSYGGHSEIDSQGRVLMPSELRRLLELESQPVWIDYYNGGINVAGKKIHEERMQRARVNLADKVKTLRKNGLK